MRSNMFRMAAGWIAAAILFYVPAQAAEPVIGAESAILMDGSTGRVLFQHHANKRSLIASTTKIMTALVIIEDCALSTEISIPAEAASVEGSSMYLEPGEICTIEELLYGMMLHSGNDAAVSLAMHHSGSIENFADRMNEKAQELGLTDTSFANPHGLDAQSHYSTAWDLAKLAAYSMENEIFRQIVSTKSIAFGDRKLTNHNRLLWSYPGAVGVKTGYTMAAGRILVSAAERNGRRLIVVTIDDRDDWSDHARLFDHGFEAYTNQLIAFSGQTMGFVSVICGAEKARAVLRDEIWMPLAGDETVELQVNLPPMVFAPILAGECAGSVDVIVDGVAVKHYPLYWKYSVFEEA